MKMQGAARRLAAREWLLPFADGGFASGTIAGIPARSYHGLMVVTPAAGERRLLVGGMDEAIVGADGSKASFSSWQSADESVHGGGSAGIVAFRDDGEGPVWTLRVGPWFIERSIRRVDRGVEVAWALLSGPPARLEVRPFLTDRSYHGGAEATAGELFVHEQNAHAEWTSSVGRRVEIETSGVLTAAQLDRQGLRLATEAERGLACHEDVHAPLVASLELTEPGESGRLAFRSAEIDDEGLTARSGRADDLGGRLRAAVRAYLVRDQGRPGILAGYPWFNEWGRDTMIAASGVAEAVGWDPVLEILEIWGTRLSRGMIPNRLAESEDADLYNSVDAALWMLVAIQRAAVAAPAPQSVLARFQDAVEEVVRHYRQGTRHGIAIDPEDGLLTAGEGSVQLTWMDAKVGDRPITPRHGKCVEINALYHSALALREWSARLDGRHRDAVVARQERESMAAAIVRAFAPAGCPWIRDILDDEHDGLRPNVLIAMGAPFSPFPREACQRTLLAVRRELMTPCGPRTLSPRDHRYRGRCVGGVLERDEAYHQGTVWPWLMGPYADAVVRVSGSGSRPRLRSELQRVVAHVMGRVVPGQVPEIFDGDAPHPPRGAPAQAWSVAELLRASVLSGLVAARKG